MTRALLLALLTLWSGGLHAAGIVARTADGREIEIALAPASYIVEFHEPPLALANARTAASYRKTIDRLRRDLQSGVSAKRAIQFDHEYFRAFHGVSMALDAETLAKVRALPYVKRVHEDGPVRKFAEDATRLERISVPRVWSELRTRGEGIVVAVIDTGVDADHPALAGKVIGGWDFFADDADPRDEEGHGTHVAGIIAGNDFGVAPGVRILSLRVLGPDGNGSQSDVVAGIERTLDPNGDGDLSDRADVANVSLGGRGHADSASSVAIDVATAAGVVFAVAAGNTPGGMSIGAPAASRGAITVGSSDRNDALAPYSSHGPAFPDLHLKPDVLAPGSDILSARLGGGTLVASGTSMAAPHVAGVAALLRALHPEWTPSQVKAAIIAGASPIEHEVMAQGAGRIDAYRSASAATAAWPSSLGFGRDVLGQEEWTSSRTTRVTNLSRRPQTFNASIEGMRAGVLLAAEPSTFTLEPGESREVTIAMRIVNAASGLPSQSTLSFGGRVVFTSERGSLAVPWAVVKAAQVTTVTNGPANVLWTCDNGFVAAPIPNQNHHPALLPATRCESITMFAVNALPRAIILRAHDVAGDAELPLSEADAPHAIDFAGVDEHGALLRAEPDAQNDYRRRIHFHFGPRALRSLTITEFGNDPLRVGGMEQVPIGTAEARFDFARDRIYVVQHAPLKGVSGNVRLANAPGDLYRGRVHVAASPHELRGFITDIDVTTGRGMGFSTVPGNALASGWSGDVFLTKDLDPSLSWRVSFHTYRREHFALDLITPALRVADGRIVLDGHEDIPAQDTYFFGRLPVFSRPLVSAIDGGFLVVPIYAGALRELHIGQRLNTAFEVRDGSGSLLEHGAVMGDVPQRRVAGAYRFDLSAFDGALRTSMTFDTRAEDFTPPLLNGVMLLDGRNRVVSTLAPNAPASLVFSAADYTITPRGVQQYAGAVVRGATRAFWRPSGTSEWRALPLVETGEEAGTYESLGRFARGIQWRADLSDVALTRGAFDLRIEIADAVGNTTTMTLDRAAAVDARRRGVAH